MEEPMFGSPHERALQGFDFYHPENPVEIAVIEVPATGRLPQEVFYLPALLLLGLVIALQRRRQTKPAF